ncbi:hypothetical protein GCM10007860_29100 [Chitiniphilus shinanonensis]|uniref:Erythromycin esterase n=1 Tax=Chitiniphilus shinanonensis TaxID=553088 RepID=A0ABQ6BUU2_9NEIS|nr:erythromycin esterase family protein [Chitiniphilus shinanonensis]GLS05753.1 hypothetical protein GCM10007860_29100 [Chitiniphilus shinanonensis]
MRNLRKLILAGCIGLLLAGCGGGGDGGGGNEALTNAINANGNALVSIDYSAADMSDLTAFGNAVGDARIVFLNESVHGEGATLTLMARLVKYLHEQKQFDVLLFESGIYDVARMKEKHDIDGMSYTDSSAGRIFYLTSRTAEGRKVFEYLDQTQATASPLALAGIDIMMAGVESTGQALSRLQLLLTLRNSPTLQSPDWSTFMTVADKVVNLPEGSKKPDGYDAYQRVVTALRGELCVDAGGVPAQYDFTDLGLWCRVVESLGAGGGYLWNKTPANDWDQRDIAAAGNAAWLLEGPFKGRKAIVWTHSFHGLATSLTPAHNTARELQARYPGQIHTVQISVGGMGGDPERSALEYHLGRAGAPRYLAYPADADARNALAGVSIKEYGLMDTHPNNFGTAYQSLFYVSPGWGLTPDFNLYPVN